MKVIYQGQIGVVAGLQSEDIIASGASSLAEVIAEIAASKSNDVQQFLLDDKGNVRQSLFVAVDGEHTRDFDQVIGEAHELLLMPPMAGG